MDDSLFDEVWEKQFSAPGLDTPWYAILVSHYRSLLRSTLNPKPSSAARIPSSTARIRARVLARTQHTLSC